jgi:hypothetical protein
MVWEGPRGENQRTEGTGEVIKVTVRGEEREIREKRTPPTRNGRDEKWFVGRGTEEGEVYIG